MTVISDGSRSERVAVDAADQAGHLERVVDRPRAEAEALPGLVELDREGPVHVEVAGLDRQVVGLERAAALLVDDVEGADEPDVVDEVGEVAGPPAAIEVAHEGRPADRPEDEVRAAEARCSAPGCGRAARNSDGAIATSASTWAGSSRTRRFEPVHGRAGTGERVERPVAEHLDPDLGQDPQRRPVDRLDLVGRQDLDRPERVDQPPPRQLRETGRRAARPATRAVVRLGGGGLGRISGFVHGCYGAAAARAEAGTSCVDAVRGAVDFSCVSQMPGAQ